MKCVMCSEIEGGARKNNTGQKDICSQTFTSINPRLGAQSKYRLDAIKKT